MSCCDEHKECPSCYIVTLSMPLCIHDIFCMCTYEEWPYKDMLPWYVVTTGYHFYYRVILVAWERKVQKEGLEYIRVSFMSGAM